MKLPAHLPEPPPAPKDHEWEYRGQSWNHEKVNIFTFAYLGPYNNSWCIAGGTNHTFGYNNKVHFLEAVPILYRLLGEREHILLTDEWEIEKDVWSTCDSMHTENGMWNKCYKPVRRRVPKEPEFTKPFVVEKATIGTIIRIGQKTVNERIATNQFKKYLFQYFEELNSGQTDWCVSFKGWLEITYGWKCIGINEYQRILIEEY